MTHQITFAETMKKLSEIEQLRRDTAECRKIRAAQDLRISKLEAALAKLINDPMLPSSIINAKKLINY